MSDSIENQTQQPPIDIRQALFAEFVSHYQAISVQLQRLPLDIHLKSLALQQFYLGFLLAKEAFFTMNVDALKESEDKKEHAEEPRR